MRNSSKVWIYFCALVGVLVSGKPLKEHKEVEGHAQAIDLLYEMLDKDNIDCEDIFFLHKAVQTEIIFDIYRPIGNWKVEDNGTYHITEDGKQIFLNYVEPKDVPRLMHNYLKFLNSESKDITDKEHALTVYTMLHTSFVHIHPFADGNGRMARLISNIPVLKAGFPPIIVDKSKRYEYITLLSSSQIRSDKEKL